MPPDPLVTTLKTLKLYGMAQALGRARRSRLSALSGTSRQRQHSPPWSRPK